MRHFLWKYTLEKGQAVPYVCMATRLQKNRKSYGVLHNFDPYSVAVLLGDVPSRLRV